MKQTYHKFEYLPGMRSACFVFLFFCILGSVSAQYQIPFLNYSMKNGLMQNQVFDICQDHKGYIWMATTGGVSRFDGTYFKNFTVSDGLPVNVITELLVDRRNRIWMATNGGGLTVFDGKTFHTYTTGNGLASNHFKTDGFNKILIEDSKGNIWCRSAEEGVSMIGESEVITYNKSNGLASNKVTCLKEDTRGRILCGTGEGLSVIHQGKIVNHVFSQGVSNVVINQKDEIWLFGKQVARFIDGQPFVYHAFPQPSQTITAVSDFRDRLWIATDRGELFIFGDEKLTLIRRRQETVFKIFEDSRRNTWLSTRENGVYKYVGDQTENYIKLYGLLDNTVNCVFEDTEGNIWIGTEGGASMYGKVIFERLTVESGFPGNHISSVAVDSSGWVWCSPDHKGLVRINDRKITFFESPVREKDSPFNTINSIASAGEDLILGSGTGTGRFTKGRFIFDRQIDDTHVNYILTLNDHEYWVASSDGLIHVLGKNKEHYTVADGLPDNDVRFLLRDGQGKIWCTTPSGLSVFDGKQFVNYTVENGLPNNSCTDLEIDPYGAIWVGTENGLCKITKKNGDEEFKTYTVTDGLSSNMIHLIHYDRNGSERLWVGYPGGLNAIDLKTDSIVNYTEADGYRGWDCYYGAAVTDMQGNVWFGTVEGLLRYNPQADIRRTTLPRTYITGISLTDGSDIALYADSISSQTGLPVNLVLPHHQNNIRMDWIGIHFTIPSKIRYSYILEGYENTWHEESTATFREYRLSPGRYTFKVIACNNDGVWNTEPVEFSFTVRRQWWASIFAYIDYAILLAALIYLYVRWRGRWLRKRNRILEQKVHERTVEIQIQKQEILEVNKLLLEVNKLLKEHKDEMIMQRDMAAGQRDKIAEQRREIMDSIHYAEKIQKAIMPDQSRMSEIFDDHFVFFRPLNVVSGDYYWATRKGSKMVVVAADCTGHGVPGAFMSILGITLLNEIVLKREIDTASEILDELRENIKFTLSQKGTAGEQRDGMDMALCIIDYEAMKLQYAGAYNPLYLVRNSEMIEYKPNKMPVGIFVVDNENNFTNHRISLQPGDTLYLFSDGYIDQFGGEKNTKFKSKQFKQLLLKISSLPMNRQKQLLIESHEKWKGHSEQVDDILVIGIRI